MLPQLACGGRTPTPKKLSADSSRMPRATASVIETVTACAAFGSRWRDQHAQMSGARRPRALDEAAAAERDELGADDARGFHPAGEADEHDQHRHGRPQHDRHNHQQRQPAARRGAPSVTRISTASAAPRA